MHIRPDEIENRQVAVTLRLNSRLASFRMTWYGALKGYLLNRSSSSTPRPSAKRLT